LEIKGGGYVNPIEALLVSKSSPDIAVDTRAGEPSAKKLRYTLIIPVWGDHHTRLFLRYCIPFLFTDGNIGAFGGRQLRVHVLSRRVDFALMKEDIYYRRLAAVVQLIESEIDDIIDLSAPYRAVTECYLSALRTLPDPDDTVTIFPTPDCIVSRNALQKIVELMEDGWRGVMVCGLRVTLESAEPLLDQVIASPGGAEDIGERELCEIALNNLHSISLRCDVRSEEFMVSWPSHVYWIAPDRSWLIAHCFHLHPLAVRGVPTNIDIHTTIDGDYLVELGADAGQFYICNNSDAFFCVELSPSVKRVPARTGSLRKRYLVRFSVSACNALHRRFFSQAIWWKTSPDPNVPDDLLHEAADYVAAVRRGSFLEEMRFRLLSIVRRYPPLLFAARAIVRGSRRVFASAGEARAS
jgi:hypothetical protein